VLPGNWPGYLKRLWCLPRLQQPTRLSAAHPGVVRISVFSATVFGAACTRPAAASRQQTANSATADLPAMTVHPSAKPLNLLLQQNCKVK
jgi:hypothetical protein